MLIKTSLELEYKCTCMCVMTQSEPMVHFNEFIMAFTWLTCMKIKICAVYGCKHLFGSLSNDLIKFGTLD